MAKSCLNSLLATAVSRHGSRIVVGGGQNGKDSPAGRGAKSRAQCFTVRCFFVFFCGGDISRRSQWEVTNLKGRVSFQGDYSACPGEGGQTLSLRAGDNGGQQTPKGLIEAGTLSAPQYMCIFICGVLPTPFCLPLNFNGRWCASSGKPRSYQCCCCHNLRSWEKTSVSAATYQRYQSLLSTCA